MTSATLRGSTFENARLDRTSARGANFEDSNFVNASIQNADLSGANFQGSDLSNTNFSGSTLGSDWRLQFRGARFENTTWVDGKVYSATPDSP
ncbi:MAG: pentapeptide repeat-containing protein [Ilumatobacteraceae bacterium]